MSSTKPSSTRLNSDDPDRCLRQVDRSTVILVLGNQPMSVDIR